MGIEERLIEIRIKIENNLIEMQGTKSEDDLLKLIEGSQLLMREYDQLLSEEESK